jgi:hypothetical protein
MAMELIASARSLRVWTSMLPRLPRETSPTISFMVCHAASQAAPESLLKLTDMKDSPQA